MYVLVGWLMNSFWVAELKISFLQVITIISYPCPNLCANVVSIPSKQMTLKYSLYT